uniref:Uncharacterized protein n=1 Tax=Physcomitrium patens TaxID=3218 RepID=A0A2K1J8F4_PHYPA|nr:hypothetical protein PHYPA_020917 [Physcomitrium patens]
MNLAHPRLIRKTPYSDPFLSQPHALIDPSLAPRKAAGCISLSLVVTEVVKLNCLVEEFNFEKFPTVVDTKKGSCPRE